MSKGTKRVAHSRTTVAAFQQHSAPLPTPSDFAGYDAALPGAAERILSMAEKQSSHRQALELKVISSDTLNSRLGTIFGFLLGASGLVVAGYVIVQGHDWAGVGIGGGTLATMVIAFLKRPTVAQKNGPQPPSA